MNSLAQWWQSRPPDFRAYFLIGIGFVTTAVDVTLIVLGVYIGVTITTLLVFALVFLLRRPVA